MDNNNENEIIAVESIYNDIKEKANQKRLKHGGFSKRIFLEKTYK